MKTKQKTIIKILMVGLTLIFYCQAFADNKMIKVVDDKIVLDNGNMRLSFASGNKLQLIDLAGTKSSWTPGNSTLWQLTLVDQIGVNPTITPANGTYKGYTIRKNGEDSAEIAFTWEMLLHKDTHYDVRVIVNTDKKSKLVEWAIEADMPQGCIVTNVDFPILSLKRENAAKVIIPEGWGVDFNIDNYFNYTSEYASHNGGMQMVCLHNENSKEALYYATHDQTASIKNFMIKAEPGSTLVKLNVPASFAWTSSSTNTFRLPWKTSIGLCDDGWEGAVRKWYIPFTRTTVWGAKPLTSRHIPVWLLNADLWLRPNGVTQETEDWLKKALNYYGKDITACHWYYWHNNQFDIDYPDYFPAKDGFTTMVNQAQKMGTHVIPYINGRLWDPASVSYKEQKGTLASCRKADETIYTELSASKVTNTVTCPSSEVWQNLLVSATDKLLSDIHVDGVYIDQICAARGVPCYASNHQHPLGGGEFWQASYRQMVSKMLNKKGPGNILMSEENAECFIDLFDVLLMVNTPNPKQAGKIVPLFPMVYSDRVLYCGFQYFSEPVNSLDFVLKNALALLWGSQLGWIEPYRLMAPEASKEAKFLKDMTVFRNKQHDIFCGGQFIKEVIPTGDNPVLLPKSMQPTSAVRGAQWTTINGKTALVLINLDNIQHKINLPNGTSTLLAPSVCYRIDL